MIKMRRFLLLPFIILFTIANAQEYWMQDGSVTTCEGLFYDSGGPNGLFSNGENYTFTICPDRTNDPDLATILTFLHPLYMEPTEGIDYITIYDGDSTNAPVIGTWQGGQTPGGVDGVQASDIGMNATGCLTVVFISDPAGPGPGWSAEISCQVPCQSILPNVITEPAMDNTGTVNITEGDSVTFHGSADFSQDGSGATYMWDFGDGNSASGTDTTHTYGESGTYTASLTVSDSSGDPSCQQVYTFLVIVSYDDNVPCPSVVGIEQIYASDDVYINCEYPLDENGCLVLYADYVSIKETTSYIVQSIPFQPPYPVDQGAGIAITTDDDYGPIVNFPAADSQNNIPAYRFCFFGEVKDELVVGANGRINFDTSYALNSDNYTVPSGLPTSVDHMMNTINGAYHDLQIRYIQSYGGTLPDDGAQFSYGFQGSYPCRMFVVNYNNIPLYDCPDMRTTQQIILWEGSNYIDIYLHNKPDCTFTEDLVGLQGPSINQFAVPPGRNTSDWEAYEEAWRFIPDGPELPVTIEWFDANGDFVGTGQELDICPTEDTFYTVQVTYELCGMDPVVVSDIINVTLDFEDPIVDPITENVCDTDGDDEVLWDLYTITSGVYDINENYTIQGFYTNPRSADEGGDGDRIENPAEFLSGTTVIYINVIHSETGCYSVIPVNLNILDDLSVSPYTVEKCIPPGETEVSFNLFDYNEYFLNGEFYDIYFYLNESDAIDNEPNFLENENIIDFTISENTTVYVRVVGEEGCFGVSELNLVISEGTAGYTFDAPVDFCDSPTIGEEIVDLTLSEAIIANGTDGLTFNYFESLDDANSNDASLAILDPMQYNLLDSVENIFITVSDEGGCTTIITMPVTLSTGLALEPQSIELCDIDNDDTENFDLTSVQGDLVVLPENYTFIYFNSEEEAVNNDNPITTDITQYSSSNNQIWVFVEDIEGCSSITSIELNLIPVPEINQTTLNVCANAGDEYIFDLEDATTELLNGQDDLTLSYFNNEIDAIDNNIDNEITNINEYISTTENEVIYVRLENSDCFVVSTITLSFNPQPVALDSPIIEICDAGADGSEIIDLTQNESIITDGTNDVTVNFYTTEDDANNDTNIIADPTAFEASSSTNMIYVRVTNNLGCYAVNSFEVNLIEGLELLPSNITLCDEGLDDLEVFDLTSNNTEIINNSDEYAFQYFNSIEDLENDMNPIEEPTSYSSGESIIYIKVSNDNCFASTTLELILQDGPEAGLATLAMCADADGNYIFNLTDAIPQLSNGNDALDFTFYNNLSDAEDDNTDNAITDLENYIGTEDEIIYINISNGTCSSVSELVLNYLPVPIANQPNDIVVCDIEGTGNMNVDLTSFESDIIGAQTGITVTYYLNQDDADNNEDAIGDPESYSVSVENLTIYVRIDNGSCYDTTHFDVTINSLSLANQSIVLCDIGEDSVEDFDLTLMNEEIVNGETDYTFTYFESYTDAIANTNEITSNITSYNSSGQIIYVVATNSEDCSAVAELTLVLEELPTVNTDLAYPLCDPEFDGIYGFELTDLDNIVVSNPAAFNIAYYNSLEDAENGTNPLTQTDADDIRSVPMLIYVRVEKINAEPNCVNYTSVTLDEAPQTEINENIAPLESCEENNGYALFDLTTINSEVTSDPNDHFITYHSSLEDAQNEINPLDPTNAELADGTIYVRAHAQGKCPSIASIDVVVNPKPVAEIFSPLDATCANESIQISAVDYDPTYSYEWKDQTGTVLGIDPTLDVYGVNGDQSIKLVVTNPSTFCYAESTFDFEAIDLPTITALETTENSIQVTATGEGPFEYSLDGVNWQQNTVFENLPTGLYDVYIRTLAAECEGVGMSTLILDIPKVITPNNDGYNDYFVIPYMDTFRDADGNVQTSYLQIFDRFGKLLLSEESSNEKTSFVWDGTFGNRVVNTGDYWYLLVLADGRRASGHITVKNR